MSMLANPNDDVFAFIRTSRRACISKRRNSKDDKFPLLKGGSYTELFRVRSFVRSFVRVYTQSYWLIQYHTTKCYQILENQLTVGCSSRGTQI
jgi:hypothetical protein